jgi:hypothetical protein
MGITVEKVLDVLVTIGAIAAAVIKVLTDKKTK